VIVTYFRTLFFRCSECIICLDFSVFYLLFFIIQDNCKRNFCLIVPSVLLPYCVVLGHITCSSVVFFSSQVEGKGQGHQIKKKQKMAM